MAIGPRRHHCTIGLNSNLLNSQRVKSQIDQYSVRTRYSLRRYG